MDYTWSDKVLKLGLNHPIKDGKPLDLTLRLGQPISNDDLQSSYQSNEGTKYSENRLNGEILQLGTGGQFPTSLFPDIIGTFPQVGYSNNMTEFVGFPSNHHPFNYHLNIGFNNIPTAAGGGSLLPSHEPNYSYGSYNVGKDVAVLPLLGNVENGTSSSRRRGTDLGKRCMNVNCNATETPMWRRGPLGPKTLCNACGIKFRKEEDRRKAREAAMNGTNTREA